MKEMLFNVIKPTIQYIVEEALASGIGRHLIVTGKSKRPIPATISPKHRIRIKPSQRTELLEPFKKQQELTYTLCVNLIQKD